MWPGIIIRSSTELRHDAQIAMSDDGECGSGTCHASESASAVGTCIYIYIYMYIQQLRVCSASMLVSYVRS